jgi:hypothetical protein
MTVQPNDQTTPETTSLIRCPKCGSLKVTLDYDATVSLRVVDGVVEAVLVGGVLGTRPTNFFCEDCDHLPVPADEATDASLSAAEDTLPVKIGRDLNEGFYVFGGPIFE